MQKRESAQSTYENGFIYGTSVCVMLVVYLVAAHAT